MCVGFFVIVVVGFFFGLFIYHFLGGVCVCVCMEKALEKVSNHLGKYCMA